MIMTGKDAFEIKLGANQIDEAAKNLVDLIERPKTTLVQRVVVKGRLLEGETLKKLN
ncbi:MAG: hypothetical protein J6X14_02340 [Lachnospiraceae bacterium]|nr:hypothetical protein [Lachnospiraceae bacterium]